MTIVVNCKYEREHEQHGLAELLIQRALLEDSNQAIQDGEDALSYRNLHAKAMFLSWQILQLSTDNDSPVGILVPRSLNHVLSQVAIIYAGRACVPLDDQLPDSHLEGMLQNIHVRLVITTAAQQHRLPSSRRLVVDHHTLPCNADNIGFEPVRQSPQACSHVFHTSGTTGKPKAVEARAEGLINLCLDPVDLVRRGQRMAHGTRPIFDISVVEIWGTLLRGGTILVVPQSTLLDPLCLEQFIRAQKVDAMVLTTSLLTVTAYSRPGAFSTLDTLTTGGEAINCPTIAAIFRAGAPRRIINGYGPSEASVFALLHVVTEEEAIRGQIPIGKPPCNVETFVVDEEMQPVEPGQVGELLIAGIGVAGGYLHEPDKTDRSFLSLPHLPRTVKCGTGKAYRTGDLVQRDAKGVHYYIGRFDHQVKIRGHRVELEALEATLLQTGLVRVAVIIKITPAEVGKGQFLLAFCIPTTDTVTAGAITKAYIEQAPHHIVPRVELIDSLPLGPTGKADRRLLEKQYFDRVSLARKKRVQETNGNAPLDAGAQIRDIWIDVFGLVTTDLAATDDFVAMGGTSLMAAVMIARINQTFGISLRAQMLYENTTVEALTLLVVHLLDEGEDDVQSHSEAETWLQDSRLGEGLRAHGRPIMNWLDPSEGRVFLTGSTGFVGIFLLATLVRRPEVKQVACLVRAADEAAAQRRLQLALAQYALTADSHKVIAIAGDFSRPQLGLTTAQYDYYAQWASVVFHLGAKVSYVAPYSSHREENVIGTLRMLEFANHRRLKQLHYTSTIAAYGPTGYVTGAKKVEEDERPAAHLAALSYDTGYAQSQYVAEAIVWNAIDNGFPVAIYRPGFVVGHSQIGVCNPNDFVSRLYRSCLDMGTYPLLPNQRKEFVPVDFVTNALVHIAGDNQNLGHAYNLVQPDIANALDINTCFELLNRISSFPMRGIPYLEWVNSLSMRLDDPLQPLTPMLKEKVLGCRTRWEVYESMVEYGRDNLRRALQSAPGIARCDPLDVLFQKLLPSWLPAKIGHVDLPKAEPTVAVTALPEQEAKCR